MDNYFNYWITQSGKLLQSVEENLDATQHSVQDIAETLEKTKSSMLSLHETVAKMKKLTERAYIRSIIFLAVAILHFLISLIVLYVKFFSS